MLVYGCVSILYRSHLSNVAMSTLWLLSVVSSALPLTLRAARSKKFPSIANSSRSPGERSGEIEVPLPAGTPRLLVLPNGDVLVAQQSAAYVTLLRDDGDCYGRRRGRPRPRAARDLTTTRTANPRHDPNS